MSGGPASERVIARRNAHESAPGAWDIPQSWTWTAVGNVGEVGLGRQRSPINHSGPHMRPYVRAANVTWTGWDLSDVNEMNFDASDFAKFQLKYGDVVLNEGSGSAKEVGKSAIWRNEIAACCFQNTLLRVQPKACTSEYLHAYFIQAARSGRFVSETQGVNIFHIGKDGLFRFAVPLPPLPEQRRIVAKLDALDARAKRARADLDRIPALVSRAKQSVLSSFFGSRAARQKWDFKRIDEVGEVALGRQRSPENHSGPKMRPYVRSANITWQGINISDIKEMNFDDSDFEQFSLRTGDVLLNEGSGSAAEVGKPAIWRGEIEGCCFQNTVLRVRPKLCSSEFLYYVFLWAALSGRFISKTQGVNIFHIGKAGLSKFEIPLATLQEQREIIRRIESAFQKIDRIAADAASASKLLGRLDQAILTKAFRGELVPQDPEDEPAADLIARIRAAEAAPREARRRRRKKAEG
jgi:type I restriction enzyme S subunit